MDEEEVINVPFGDDDFNEEQPIYRTYRMDFEKKRIAGGMIDGIDAAVQSAHKALLTCRYAYIIYDDQYGSDIFNKIGNADLTDEYLDSDIPVMVEDCLLPEEMITGISEIEFDILNRDSVQIYVEMETIFGDGYVEGVLNSD